MKLSGIKTALRKDPQKTARWTIAIVVVLAFAGLGVSKFGHHFSKAAVENKIYLTASETTYNIGDTITVPVRTDSGDEAVNAAQANLTYNASQLQYVSISGTGSAFGIEAESKGGDGKVSIARGNVTPVSGDQLLATVTFKVLSGGSAKVDVGDDSQMLRATDQTDVTDTRTGASFTIAAATGGGTGAGSGKIYLTPATGSYKPGDSISVAVRADSGSEAVNAAEAHLTYNVSLLEFQSISGTGSAYGFEAPSSGGNGNVSIARGNIATLTGDQLLATVTFKVLADGTASIDLGSDTRMLRAADQVDVTGTRTGASYTIASPVPIPTTPTTPTTPTPTLPTQNPTTPTPRTNTTPTPTSTAKPATPSTISVTPQGSTSSSTVPGDSTIQLSTPTTIEPTEDSSDISKVEYYLNGKKVKTVTEPPYTYEVDTNALRNGTYELTTKTYKSDGSIATAKHSLNVANPLNLAQITLQAKHYWWLLAIVAILMVDVITTLYLRHKNGRSGGSLLDMLMPWRNRAEELSFAGNSYNSGAPMADVNPYVPAPQPPVQEPMEQSGTSDNKLDHFTPSLPQAGQVVAPKPGEKPDDDDPYNLLPRS